jgi:uncharacterized protein
MNLLLYLVGFSALILLANQAELMPKLRPSLYAALSIYILLFWAAFGLLPAAQTPLSLGLASAVAGLMLALLMPATRRALSRFFRPAYQPQSPLQTTALLLSVSLVGYTTLTFVLSGGLAGLSADPDAGINYTSLIVQMCFFLMVAFLGVGLGVRRSLPAALDRLGLAAPTFSELNRTALWIGALCAAYVVAVLVWVGLTSPEDLAQQTQASERIANSINTLTLAFAVAFTAAVGEEILYRGALQPIFGLWPTAIFFVLAHNQYLLTPAALILLIVSLFFGLIRQRIHTTAAIIAHFVYNFLPIALSLLAGG